MCIHVFCCDTYIAANIEAHLLKIEIVFSRLQIYFKHLLSIVVFIKLMNTRDSICRKREVDEVGVMKARSLCLLQ